MEYAHVVESLHPMNLRYAPNAETISLGKVSNHMKNVSITILMDISAS